MHDISKIRKYLNGELDARAMHQLERQAQDDPFLMDALEGYQNAKADQQTNLDDLASRLNRRVAEKRTRIIPFRAISIAASVLVICSAGVWWLYQGRQPVKSSVKNESVQSGKTPSAAPTTDTVSGSKTLQAAVPGKKEETVSKQVKPANQLAAAPPAAAAIKPNVPAAVNAATQQVLLADAKVQQPAPKDSTSLDETIVMGYTAARKKDTSNFFGAKRADKIYKSNTAPQQQLQAQAPGVKVYPSDKQTEMSKLLTSGSLGNLGINQLMTNQGVHGKVIAQNNGLPIQGATIKVPGTNQVTKTDAEGYFRLNLDTSHTKLEIANRGYHTRQYNTGINGRDSIKTITLAPADSTELGESIATGFTSQAKDANEIFIAAHPQKGWGAFRRYLKINAVAADGAAGIVKLTFSVDKNGSVSDIRIEKGLSAAADKKAISMVKDGPDWVGNTNKLPEKVTLRIKFSKK